MNIKIALPNGKSLRVRAEFPYDESPIGYRVLIGGKTGIVVGLAQEGEDIDLTFPDKKPLTTEKHILSILETANYYAQLPWKLLFSLVPSAFNWREEEYLRLGEKDWKFIDKLSLKVLEYVKKKRAIKEENLKKRFGRDVVEKLLELGFLKRVKEWKMPNLTTTYYSLLVPPEETLQRLKHFKKREERLRLIIYYLLEKGTVSREELRSAGFKGEDIRALIQKGIIGEREEMVREIVGGEPTIRQVGVEYLRPLGKRSVIFGAWEGIISHLSSELERLVQEGKNAFIFCPSLSLLSVLYQSLYPLLGKKLIILRSQDKPKDFIKKWFYVSSAEGIVLLGSKIALLAPLKSMDLLVYFDENTSKSWEDFDLRHLLYTLSKYYGANFSFVGTYMPLSLCTREDWERYYHAPRAEVFVFKRKAQEIISPLVKELIKDSQEEWLFLVNKSGYAYAFCSFCGWMAECPRCKSFLTLSKDRERVFCTSCGFRSSPVCPECGRQLKELGFGIEKVVEEVQRLFGSRENFYFDTVPKLGKSYDNVLVLHGDNILSIPWFDSLERHFSYLWQALCISKKRLIVQKVLEDNPVVEFIKNKDWLGFCQEELRRREEEGLPPFKRLVRARLRFEPSLKNLPVEVKKRRLEELWEFIIKVDKRHLKDLLRRLREYKPVDLEVF
ncbi:MAG: hypothetical protein ACK4FY_02960 [Aquificaceae bacterium]